MTRPGRIVGLVAAAAMAATACGGGVTRTTFPPIGSSPAPIGDTASATTQLVINALSAVGLQGSESIRPYRPPEGPLLAAAPRTVIQANLPDDPGHGFIVVYAFPSGIAAQAAAKDHAAYVASGIGRVYFTSDARFSLRVLGPTVVFFWWSPGASLDARTESIETALQGVGLEVPVRG